jgi:protein subunit release factor A
MLRELIATYNRNDFRVETMRGTGPGGQHRNKTESKVRITHIGTGLSSECDETRNQGQNKKLAFRKLAKKIELYHRKKIQEENLKERVTKTIRTYHEVDNRVKNHRNGFTQSYDDVMNDLSDMIEVQQNIFID